MCTEESMQWEESQFPNMASYLADNFSRFRQRTPTRSLGCLTEGQKSELYVKLYISDYRME